MEQIVNTSDAMSSLTDVMTRFTGYVGKRLPTDVMKKLEALRAEEDAPLAVAVYDSMFENQKRADELDRPCCQDTGVIQYFITCGAKFPYLSGLQDALRTATLEATKKPHCAITRLKLLSRKTRAPTPVLVCRGWTGTSSRMTTVAPSRCTWRAAVAPAAKVLMPGQGYEGVNQFVFDVITSYGVNACPPLLVGVGVSTSVETAARLSKKRFCVRWIPLTRTLMRRKWKSCWKKV
jgi:L(+)-tartrate dehydratase alpha subunit